MQNNIHREDHNWDNCLYGKHIIINSLSLAIPFFKNKEIMKEEGKTKNQDFSLPLHPLKKVHLQIEFKIAYYGAFWYHKSRAIK